VTEELLEATDNYSKEREIGGGGFGIVYRGYICGTTVAVKKLTGVSINKVLQERSLGKAAKEGLHIPDSFRLKDQLNCEMWALTRYVLVYKYACKHELMCYF